MILYSILGVAILVILPYFVAQMTTRVRIHTVANAPSAQVAIVFGAGLTRDGRPTPVLRDRVATAVDLYFSGKVQKLLMSGDNRQITYNEPAAMREFAISLGVPQEDIVLDYAGQRTYDTCYRARTIFGLDQALLVTQAYHLPRALITCGGLGLQAEGVAADRRAYRAQSLNFWRLREVGATLVAIVDVYVTRPQPILGEQEFIFPQTSNTEPQHWTD